MRSAERAVQRMEEATKFEIFEENWRILLSCLEKAWIKTERSCQDIQNKFQPWQGKYARDRKQLMYLQYLKQARNADTHSIQIMTAVAQGYLGISAPNGGCLQIDSLTTDANGNTIYRGSPAIITERKPFPVAVRVENSGKWYDPPATFGDQFGTYSSPLHLAKAGLDYYKFFLQEAEKKFCD